MNLNLSLPTIFRSFDAEVVDGRSNKNKVLDALDSDIARLEQIDTELTTRIDRDTFEREGVRDSLEALSQARKILRDKEITLEVHEIAPENTSDYLLKRKQIYDPNQAKSPGARDRFTFE